MIIHRPSLKEKGKDSLGFKNNEKKVPIDDGLDSLELDDEEEDDDNEDDLDEEIDKSI